MEDREKDVSYQEVEMLADGRMSPLNAAIYIGLSQKTMAMMRCRGKGPAFVKRGRIFYFKSDLDAWLQEGRAMSTSQARLGGEMVADSRGHLAEVTAKQREEGNA